MLLFTVFQVKLLFTGGLAGARTLSTSQSFGQTLQTEEPDLGEPHAQQEEEHEGGAEDAEEQLKQDILDAALPFVHTFGWSSDAIAQGELHSFSVYHKRLFFDICMLVMICTTIMLVEIILMEFKFHRSRQFGLLCHGSRNVPWWWGRFGEPLLPFLQF